MGTHEFRLKQKDLDGTTHVHAPTSVDLQMQEALRLSGPAPNPVWQQATLSFTVQEAQETTIRLYNVLGQEVKTVYQGVPTAGETQTVQIEAGALQSGSYVLRLQSGGRELSRQMSVVR